MSTNDSSFPRARRELQVLSSDGISVVVDLAGGAPTIVHWGAHVGSSDSLSGGTVAALLDVPIPHGGLDVVAPVSLFPEHGSGYLGRPGVEGRRADGSDWAPRFEASSVELTGNSLTAVGVDAHAGLSLTSEVVLTAAGSLRMRATITNSGPDAYMLDALRMTLPVPPEVRELLSFSGRWCAEFQLNRQPWVDGAFSLDSRSGRTSHSRVPVAFVGTTGFSDESGSVWAVHLEWSGNSSMVFDTLPDGRRAVQVGELLLPGEVVLATGGSYTTPWLSAAHSDSGTNGISDVFYRYLRGRAVHPETARPVTLNTWEAVYFDHDLDTLKTLADRGAQIGAERFVLDDGWFLGRRHDRAGLGDWTVDPAVWPQGLHPLVDHVRSLGMQFGLWFEPEMVNPDSDLYRAHPDWVLADPSYTPVLGRNQLVLNLGRDDVRAYLYGCIDQLVAEYGIDYIKWDMNRELVHASSNRRAGVHAQTLGLYELLDDLRASHPGLEIETCASGGGRVDFGILERTVRVWTSDCQDPVERQLIQRGYSFVFPPETMGAHIAAPRSHSTRRTHSLEFRAGTAFFGHFGVEWNLLDVTDDELKRLATIVETHKQFRSLLHSGRVYRVDHPNPTVLINAVVAPDRSEALVSFAQMASPPSLVVEPFRVPGLDPDRSYDVKVLSLGAEPNGLAKRQPLWVSGGGTATGRQLHELGIQPPILDPESVLIVHIAGRI
jgi:alpha-galactosidase